MPRVDLGGDALHALRERLGVGIGRSVDNTRQWSFWGTEQRAWSAPVAREGHRPVWRLQLRTRLLDGYSGTLAQREALSTSMPPTSLAGIVWCRNNPEQLNLATAIDIHEGNYEWAVKLIVAAARTQAAEARHTLARADALASVGLTSTVDAAAAFPIRVMNSGEALIRDTQTQSAGSRWFEDEIATCAEALRQYSQAHAIKTAWGVSATFTQRGMTEARCILEVRRDAGRPLLGRGLSITLWAPLRGGPLDALHWNDRELGSASLSLAIGGWWAPEGGFLVHSCFVPEAFCCADLLAHWVQLSASRAQFANGVVTGREG